MRSINKYVRVHIACSANGQCRAAAGVGADAFVGAGEGSRAGAGAARPGGDRAKAGAGAARGARAASPGAASAAAAGEAAAGVGDAAATKYATFWTATSKSMGYAAGGGVKANDNTRSGISADAVEICATRLRFN